MTCRKWSETDRGAIMSALRAGSTIAELADYFHVEVEAMRSFIHRNQIVLRDVREDVFKTNAIANALGVSPHTVRRWIASGMLAYKSRIGTSRLVLDQFVREYHMACSAGASTDVRYRDMIRWYAEHDPHLSPTQVAFDLDVNVRIVSVLCHANLFPCKRVLKAWYIPRSSLVSLDRQSVFQLYYQHEFASQDMRAVLASLNHNQWYDVTALAAIWRVSYAYAARRAMYCFWNGYLRRENIPGTRSYCYRVCPNEIARLSRMGPP